MLHANRGKTNKIVNICSYNTRTINDLNSDVFDTMIHELDNVTWSIVVVIYVYALAACSIIQSDHRASLW